MQLVKGTDTKWNKACTTNCMNYCIGDIANLNMIFSQTRFLNFVMCFTSNYIDQLVAVKWNDTQQTLMSIQPTQLRNKLLTVYMRILLNRASAFPFVQPQLAPIQPQEVQVQLTTSSSGSSTTPATSTYQPFPSVACKLL